MGSGELLRQYGWALAFVLVLLFLLSRAVMRRIRQRAEQRHAADERSDRPQVGPEGFARARRQFILTLALLVIIVIVSILTHLQ